MIKKDKAAKSRTILMGDSKGFLAVRFFEAKIELALSACFDAVEILPPTVSGFAFGRV